MSGLEKLIADYLGEGNESAALMILAKHIRGLENELRAKKSQEPERWRPRPGWLASLKELAEDHHSVVDREAIQYLLIKELARELNDGWVPDWENPKQLKRGIYYSHKEKKYKDTAHGLWQQCKWYVEVGTQYPMLKILNCGDVDKLVKEICID